MTTPDTDGWTKYQREVLKGLEDLTSELKDLRTTVTTLQIQMAVAQSRLQQSSAIISTVVSAVIGMLVAAIMSLVLK